MKTARVDSNQSSRRSTVARLAAACAMATLPLCAMLATPFAQSGPPPTGQSFTSLATGYTQQLVATVDVGSYPGNATVARVLGGVAFAPDGDVWAADCLFQHTRLHRFDLQDLRAPIHGTSSLRPEVATVATEGGCGLTNHPDGALYSNSVDGVWKLDAETGAPMAGPIGQFGNALGIAVDPVTHHLIYAGKDCHDQLVMGPTTCTLWDLNPSDYSTTPFAMFPHADVPFVDGIYFDPTGAYLFVTNRVERVVTTLEGGDAVEHEVNHLTIVSRPTALVTAPSTSQIVQHLPMLSEPDGVAFHSVDHFVVTNDEAGGTMTRFDFPGGDYSQAPVTYSELQPVDGNGDPDGPVIRIYGTPFAAGGHRGDLTQVGPDSCIYATQGRNFLVTDLGTRYDDLTETIEDSIVRICATQGGFEPPPGVKRESTASIAGSAYLDTDGNGIVSGGDTLLNPVTMTLTGDASATTATAGSATPTYTFGNLQAGSYTVTAQAIAEGFALAASTPSSVAVTLAAAENRTDVNFLYVPARLTGSVYFDANDDGAIDAGDVLMSLVPLTLSSSTTTLSSSSTMSTGGPTPTYWFTGLAAGTYEVTAPAIEQGYLRTVAPMAHMLAAGQRVDYLDFLYVGGRLSGYAYVDADGNGMKDSGEPGLAGVTITGPGGNTRTTDSTGFYTFTTLAAAGYTVSAPATAGSYTRNTAGVLSATLAAGGSVPDLNFGYVQPLPPPPPGSIAGVAYIDANANNAYDSGETLLAGVAMTLGGAASASGSTTASGYSFANLQAGNYTVTAAPTALSGGFTYNLSTSSPLAVALAAGQNVQQVNFGYRAAIAYATYTQGGWGAPPSGNNPGMLLHTHFASVYPTGVTIGITGVANRYYLKFTTAGAITNFLPAGGAPKALKASATNPTSSAAGVFAGQVLAVRLAVDFSAAGKITAGLGALRVAPGYPLAGQTVTQVLALANAVLGGAAPPSGVTISMLNDVMTRINENFDNGTANNGFLVP